MVAERMKALSYAQNMEDMHLGQIFEGQAAGFYIDVGAGHPVADNVSFRAYLAGWRGLVIEPQAALHRLYGAVRPRDLALDILVGRQEGEAVFHAVDTLHGFSTMVEAHARGAADFGASYASQTRPVTTLAALCAIHATSPIDWLKIDVEGAEADVIAGHDWRRFRPRVVLVEAIAPGSMEPSHHGWEPMLLAADYAFVFFDGLNRWYLAREAAADLGGRVPTGYRDWGSVRHLYDHGRARERTDHPDHALASALMGLDPASLPLVEPARIFGFLTKNLTGEDLAAPADIDTMERFAHLWLGSEPHGLDLAAVAEANLEAALMRLVGTDAFRAALGRIAAAHDGGFIIEE
jgi:FkbM family methyltransferase